MWPRNGCEYKYLRPIPVFEVIVWSKEHATIPQIKMDVIFFSVKWQSALVYLEDIQAFCENRQKTLGDHRGTLTLLELTGVTIEPKECFLAETINCLGHSTRRANLEIAEAPTDGAQKPQDNLSRTDILSGLRLRIEFRAFVANVLHVTAPMSKNLCIGDRNSLSSVTFSKKQLSAQRTCCQTYQSTSCTGRKAL